MLERLQIIEMVRRSLDAVNRERPEGERFTFSETMPLLGEDSPLDSLEFVAFTTDLERRLGRAVGRDPRLLGDLLEADEPFRRVDSLVDHLTSRFGG